MVKCMVMEYFLGQVTTDMRESFKLAKCAAKEHITGLMIISILANGKMVKNGNGMIFFHADTV